MAESNNALKSYFPMLKTNHVVDTDSPDASQYSLADNSARDYLIKNGKKQQMSR